MLCFKAYTPSPSLSPFVDKYLVVKKCSDANLPQSLVPSNFQNIGFIVNGRIQHHQSQAESWVPRSYVLGQITTPVHSIFYEGVEVFTVVFKPAGMYQLFRIPMQEFTESKADLELIAEPQVRRMIERIFEPVGRGARIGLIEQLLLWMLHKNERQISERMAYSSELILASDGTMPVRNLSTNVYMSERTFERHFVEEVGLTPKAFAEIARMRRALELIEKTKKITWKDIYFDLQYTDQSHFDHDFRKFTGKTPMDYFKCRTDFEHFLYG